MKSREEVSEPLKPAVFQVLLSLAEGDKHGYAVLKDVEEQSGGDVRMSTGTLYAVFKRLLAEGHINLVETLAEKIAALCLVDERVRSVRIRAEKLDVYAEAASVGIEIERRRD